MRFVVALGLFLVLLRGSSYAKAPIPAATPPPDALHSGTPLVQFMLGPLIVTPTFKIGSLAVDTNVRYERTKTPDFVASAGPGLDLSLPFHDNWKLNVESSAQYLYFLKTAELRQWTGYGSSNLFFETTGTRARLTFGMTREFDRPSYEVDNRIARTIKNFSTEVERDLGRLTLQVRALYGQTRPDEAQRYRGANISVNLNTNDFLANLQTRYSVTPVSSLIVEGGYRETRFPDAPIRDFAEEAAGAGFKSTGFLKGEVTAGLRRTHLLREPITKVRPYVRGNLMQRLGRRFVLTERYDFNSAVSAFAIDGFLPTYENRTLDVDLGIELTRRFDMRIGGTRAHLISDGEIQVVIDSGEIQTAIRDDLVYEARADLGFRLGKARVSGFVSYTTRESIYFADFGIRGLMTGARVEYAPSNK